MTRRSKWGLVPIGLMMLGMAWLAWNIDNPEPNERVLQGAVAAVELNTPTITFVDLDGEQQTIVGEVEDRPPEIGEQRDVVVTTDGSADPRLRNVNPKWMVTVFGLVGLLFAIGPFIQLLWRVTLGAAGIAGAGVLAKRAADALPDNIVSPLEDPGRAVRTIGSDLSTLGAAAKAEYGEDEGTANAAKEAAGAVLVVEGVMGIDNPFSSRNRGGIYSSLIGVLAGIGLILYAPIVSALLAGESSDVIVDATVIGSEQIDSEDDDGNQTTSWQPIYEYADPESGSVYTLNSASSRREPPIVGEQGRVAFDANNPAAAIVVQSWGRWVRPGLSAFGAIVALGSLTAVALRVGALVTGLNLLQQGRSARRARGDTRSTLEVLRSAASDIVGRSEAAMPPEARGTVLSALIATRRQGRSGNAIQASSDVVGATVLADSLFGLERPFDGENTRLGIFGNILFAVVFAGLALLGIWLSNDMGYVGDRLISTGEVTQFVDGRPVIEYLDHTGIDRTLVASEEKEWAIGNHVQVAFDADSPEAARTVSRGAPAIRWFFVGVGVLGVLGLFPSILLQLAGIALGLGLLVGVRGKSNLST